MWPRLFRLPRLALAVVVHGGRGGRRRRGRHGRRLRAGTDDDHAVNWYTTTNGDTIAVPGKLHRTETLAGPYGINGHYAAHDDS